ncbi:hypothetical protein PJK47_30765, partial [Mycobacterium kansasii]
PLVEHFRGILTASQRHLDSIPEAANHFHHNRFHQRTLLISLKLLMLCTYLSNHIEHLDQIIL